MQRNESVVDADDHHLVFTRQDAVAPMSSDHPARSSGGPGHARQQNASQAPAGVGLARCLARLQTLVDNWAPGIRVTLTAAPEMAETRLGPDDFTDLMTNLLLNAREATGGGGEISVTVVAHFDGDIAAGVEVRVSDNGIGMSRHTLEQAFEPFFTTKTTGLGGLGLPIVERFVREAEGGVTIESEQGVGTTVTLWLPAPAPDLDFVPPSRRSAPLVIDGEATSRAAPASAG